MTGWMLVYIVIKSGVPYAVNAYGPGHTFEWMYECFVAREQLGADLWHKEGYFPLPPVDTLQDLSLIHI